MGLRWEREAPRSEAGAATSRGSPPLYRPTGAGSGKGIEGCEGSYRAPCSLLRGAAAAGRGAAEPRRPSSLRARTYPRKACLSPLRTTITWYFSSIVTISVYISLRNAHLCSLQVRPSNKRWSADLPAHELSGLSQRKLVSMPPYLPTRPPPLPLAAKSRCVPTSLCACPTCCQCGR